MSKRSPFAALLAASVIIPGSAGALSPAPMPVVNAPLAEDTQSSFTTAQLEQLAAPIALYPDELVGAILAAATYPLDVVEADRWTADPADTSLHNNALTAALAEQSWDDSVKSLVRFPSILKMMDTHLSWTRSLGEAFRDQPADIMDAVQRLRQRAQSAGLLHLTSQQYPINDGPNIAIEPNSTNQVNVPNYNPWCAYGPWPTPPAPPYFFSPYQGCAPGAGDIGFDDNSPWYSDLDNSGIDGGAGWPVGWGWGQGRNWIYPDWRNHLLRMFHHIARLEQRDLGQGSGHSGKNWSGGEVWHHTESSDHTVRVADNSNMPHVFSSSATLLYHGGAAGDFPQMTSSVSHLAFHAAGHPSGGRAASIHSAAAHTGSGHASHGGHTHGGHGGGHGGR